MYNEIHLSYKLSYKNRRLQKFNFSLLLYLFSFCLLNLVAVLYYHYFYQCFHFRDREQENYNESFLFPLRKKPAGMLTTKSCPKYLGLGL